jgi:hypothetical protein
MDSTLGDPSSSATPDTRAPSVPDDDADGDPLNGPVTGPVVFRPAQDAVAAPADEPVAYNKVFFIAGNEPEAAAAVPTLGALYGVTWVGVIKSKFVTLYARVPSNHLHSWTSALDETAAYCNLHLTKRRILHDDLARNAIEISLYREGHDVEHVARVIGSRPKWVGQRKDNLARHYDVRTLGDMFIEAERYGLIPPASS